MPCQTHCTLKKHLLSTTAHDNLWHRASDRVSSFPLNHPKWYWVLPSQQNMPSKTIFLIISTAVFNSIFAGPRSIESLAWATTSFSSEVLWCSLLGVCHWHQLFYFWFLDNRSWWCLTMLEEDKLKVRVFIYLTITCVITSRGERSSNSQSRTESNQLSSIWLCFACFSTFVQYRIPSPRKWCYPLWGRLPISINTTKEILHMNAHTTSSVHNS